MPTYIYVFHFYLLDLLIWSYPRSDLVPKGGLLAIAVLFMFFLLRAICFVTGFFCVFIVFFLVHFEISCLCHCQ